MMLASPNRRIALARRLHVSLGLAILALGLLVLASACGSKTPGNSCVGGVVVNGACEARCKPDVCNSNGVTDNTCVGNQCQLECTSHKDCFQDGTQDCKPAKEDDTNADIFTCQGNGRSPGIGVSCPFGTECDQFSVCPDSSICDPTACGGNFDDCKPDAMACAGVTNCTIGKCTDGSSCTVPKCAKADCKQALTCLTSGEGDADAYCSKEDCHDDSECPGGYYCSALRDPHKICNATYATSIVGNICGDTTDKCIDMSMLDTANGVFEKGPYCTMRSVCVKRQQCAPCDSDLDCSLIDAQSCQQVGPDKRCVKSCMSSKDCLRDAECDNGFCIPKFQACVGTGQMCEPCRTDLDCGDKSACLQVDSLTHERACLDLSFPFKCMADADCPMMPSKKHATCFDERIAGANAPTDPRYHRCYFPFVFDNQGTPIVSSCW